MFKLDEDASANLDAIGDTLTDEIPEPQEHAIEQAKADAASDPENPVSASVELDALGIPWNPEEHATGSDGKGVRTSKGTWRKRRGVKGSPSYLNTGAANKTTAEPNPAETARIANETQARMAGAVVAQTMIHISAAVGGEEFHAREVTLPGGNRYNERDMLTQAFGDYFIAKGVVDVPPGVALLGALSLYYLPRFREPAVRERGSRVVAWFKHKIEGLSLWRKERRRQKEMRDGKAKNVEPTDATG